MVRLDDQGHQGSGGILPAPVEPGEGAIVAGRGQQRPGAFAADAEPAGLAAVAAADYMAELGQHAALQPSQQLGAFALAQPIRIRCHRLLQLRPVADRGADVIQRHFKRGAQLGAGAGIGARGFDIDHRFAALALAVGGGHRDQAAIGVAFYRQNRVQQPVDGDAMGGNRRGYRIDNERHVVVDRGNPHQPLADRAGHRFNDDDRCGCGPPLGSLGEEARGIGQPHSSQRRIAGQLRFGQMLRDYRREASIGTVRLALAHVTLPVFLAITVNRYGLECYALHIGAPA